MFQFVFRTSTTKNNLIFFFFFFQIMKKTNIFYLISGIILLISSAIFIKNQNFIKKNDQEILKYSKHPQTFENPDPELQKQWEELKEVLCDNEHMKYYKIMIGQPINFQTVFNVMTSPSTDLTNIWSHLLFGIFFILRSLKFKGRFFWLNLITAYTYLMSACYHIFRNYSRLLYDIFLSFDVSSIAIQIFSYNIVDSISFFNKKRNDLKKKYLIGFITSTIITLISIPVILYYKFYTFRTILLSSVATVGYILIYHGYLINGFNDSVKNLLRNRIISYALQGVGIFFRASHVPERFLPDTVFQEFFHSHFWFHIAAAIGSIYACISSESIAELN